MINKNIFAVNWIFFEFILTLIDYRIITDGQAIFSCREESGESALFLRLRGKG